MLMDTNGHTILSEDYVSFEVAKLLKEKGFDEPCYSYYMTTKTLHTTFHNRVHVEEEPHFNSGDLNGMYDVDESIIEDVCSAPTNQMAMKWLREIYGIDIVIEISDPSVKDRKYYCMIWDGSNNSYILDLFGSYEEAVEAALKYVLENLI